MMKRKMLSIMLLLALASFAACGGGKVNNNPDAPVDPNVKFKTEVFKEIDRAQDGVGALISLKQSLYSNGVITQAQSSRMTGILNQVNSILKAAHTTANGITDFTPDNKQQLLQMIKDAIGVAKALNDNDLLPVKPEDKDTVGRILKLVNVSLDALNVMFGGQPNGG